MIQERERGITITSAAVTCAWRGRQINLIDTPGHVDFTAEVERSLRVLDGGVVVFSAREGVEAQSETVWRQADKYHVPRLAFINKMDREGADFFGTLHEMEDRLECKTVPVTLPAGAGPAHVQNPFRAIVDLIEMQLLSFDQAVDGAKVLAEPIPDELRDEAEEWRARMLDHLSLYSDELTERMLAEEAISPALVRQVLRQATIHGMVVPVLCGSALRGIGVQPVLDAVAAYLPSPLDMPPVEGADPKDKDAKARRKPLPEEPFCGLLFKVQAERHGDLDYVRVYSGRLKAGSRVYNPRTDKRENVPQLWRIQADHREQVAAVEAGDIVGIVGLKHSATGDTLCHPQHPIVLEPITFPETVVTMAIEPETSLERKKLSDVLEMMKRQDPTFRAKESEETGQTIISGMGELHLEVITHRLLRDYKLNVRVHKPRVSYRETIEKRVEVTGHCHRTMAGQQLFAELRIEMLPIPGAELVASGVVVTRPEPLVLVTGACRQQLPNAFLVAADQVLRDQLQGGGMLGFPVVRVAITIESGKFHETESNELAFRLAAADAFNRGLREAGIVLLEPIMRLEIITPEEYLGEFVSDLQQRRAEIVRTHTRGRNTVIEARAPLAELFGYSSAMRGLSQGRASCTMEPCTYGAAPPEVLRSFL